MSDSVVKTRVSVTLTAVYIRCLDQLVEVGVFASRGEAVKAALRALFRSFNMPPFAVTPENAEPPARGGTDG